MKSLNKLFLLFFALSHALSAAAQTWSDTLIKLEFPNLPPTMHYLVTGQVPLAMASVYLPADYTPGRKFPVVLWIDGGMGSAGDGAAYFVEKFGNRGFIYINLPQFKKKIEPLLPDSSNYWPRLMLSYNQDNEIIWKSYKIMLDSIWSLVPAIDKDNCFMGGFSNGAHTTAILLNRPDAEITRYFNKFLFIEGGLGLSNFEVLRGRPVIFMQGGKSPDWIKPLYQKALEKGAKAVYIRMEGYGHEFPPPYQEVLKKWILENTTHK